MQNDLISNYLSKRNDIILKINEQKYGDMVITQTDLKFSDKFEQTDKNSFDILPDDFYSNLAIKYKNLIEDLPIFKRLNLLPKGALLHHHLADDIDPDFFLSLLDDPNIYLIDKLFLNQKSKALTYSKKPLANAVKIQEIKEKYIQEQGYDDGLKNFERFVKESLSISHIDLSQVSNNDQAWKIFFNKMIFGMGLVQYKLFYEKHVLNVFKSCIENKFYRLETRITLGLITDENNKFISLDEEMKIYQNCLDEIRKEHPIFSFGIIIQLIRRYSDDLVAKKMREGYDLKVKYGDLVIGLDFAGDENNFRKFSELSSIILLTQKQLEEEFMFKLPLILHCGESLKLSNQNPIDGILLEAKRFGHGLNLLKFPYLLDSIKKNNICIEVNPISNQLLKNVIDLRWHPAITYLGMGIKIVISNDDPTIYGTKGINYDLVVGMAAFEMNIIDLKRVLINSLECSMIETSRKEELIRLFYEDWDEAVRVLLLDYKI